MLGCRRSRSARRASGDVVTRQADHVANAIRYLDTYTTIDDGSVSDLAFLATAQARHPEIVATVRDAVTRSSGFFTASGGALRETADYYENTDYEAAAALDATYTGAEHYDVVYQAPPDESHAPAEQADPSSVLVEPAYDEGAFDPSPFGLISDFNIWFSPAVWLIEAVKEAVGYDILDSVRRDPHALQRRLRARRPGVQPQRRRAHLLAAGVLGLLRAVHETAHGVLRAGAGHVRARQRGDRPPRHGVRQRFWACVAAGVTAATAEAVLPAVISGLLGAGQLAKALEAATAITGQIELGRSS